MSDDRPRSAQLGEATLRIGKPTLVALSLVALGACSTPDESPDEPVPSVAPAPDAVRSPADQRRAEAAVLKLKDLGKGYNGAPQPRDERADEDDAVLSACLGRPPTRTRETAKALSQVFTSKDARRIRAGASFVTTEAEATADLQALLSDKAPKCLEDLMRADLERQGAEATVEVERLPAPVPGSAALSLVVHIKAENGQLIPVITDYVAAVKGRGEVDAYFQEPNGHVDSATVALAMKAMLARL
jgi:hypothetical protein